MAVATILEAHVAPKNWTALEEAYKKGSERMPPQLMQSFLIHSTTDITLWRIISVWRSREALEEMRRSGGTLAGILMFRAAGAEPALSIFDVVAHIAST